ncbi:MAG TPA: alkaline phosphatase family protein [Rudaea sp.]|jgi:predicted AlkP superfamily pyrophosphatase or phosphodiesterase
MPRFQLVVRGSLATALLALVAGCGAPVTTRSASHEPAGAKGSHRVIVFVWDGMRPDSVDGAETPNLFALARRGTRFADNHSSYPTFTMMNAAAFATGAFSGESGFYGNTVYRPGAPARTSGGDETDMNDPVFTEDYGVLRQLDQNQDEHLFLIGTLFQAAQKAGLKTAVVGKSGPAFLQDYKNGGVLLDEKAAFPLSFARELQAAHIALPATAPFAYADGALKLRNDNGDPTFQPGIVSMADHVTPDPGDSHGAPPTAANKFLMSVFLDYILPQKRPDLSVVWLRNPDSTEHAYGVGAPNYHMALKAQDELLGKLEARLTELGLDTTTDLIVVSDHGHSNVSGPLDLFPLRKVESGKIGAIDREHGYSVSGEVRLAHELSMAGIRAYDGGGCFYDPVMSGILADGGQLHPDKKADASNCPDYKYGKFTTPDYQLLHPFLPREAFVIASNGGTDYLYHPAHDPERIRAAVRFLQSREEFGAIFVDPRYGDIPGTLPLSIVHLENVERRNPDIVVGYTFDEHAMVQGMPGIEFQGVYNHISRGMHGSFSPVDVHNTLLAFGPDFRENFVDTLPSGNVDVAPTIARILGVELPQADGRPLLEALSGREHIDAAAYAVAARSLSPQIPAKGLSIKSPIGTDTGKTSYTFGLQVKELRYGSNLYTYFDWAKAERD